MPDKYATYQELARFEHEGVDFTIRQARGKSMTTLVLGLHAGRIEPGISEIVLAVAGDELSYYLFEGIKSQGNKDLHITSTHFDEPGCLALMQTSENVIAIHGERSDDRVVYLGGLDKQLKKHLMTALREHDFMAKGHAKPLLQGASPQNICNRGKSGAGVQLELSNGLRQTFFQSLNTDGKRRPTVQFYKFIAALRNGLRHAGML
jgi:phage replication-related protein YjqB (UPF0714/DUF867 family)